MSFLDDLKRSAQREFDVDQDTNRKVAFEARKRKGKSETSPAFTSRVQSYRTPQVVKAALGFKQDPAFQTERKRQGISIDTRTAGSRLGSVLGAIGADLRDDSLRSFYWLLNAAQATGDVITEEIVNKARPDLYDIDPRTKRPKYGARGSIKTVAIPAGVAINTGLGLMTPFGGAEGYYAALPSDEDPTKTSNVLGEVALKYFMGRTGNLLPYEEFKKVRPDVSPQQYGEYKGYKYSKDEDWNPFDDGQTSMLAGALRTTTEGIHGPEVQFLGRSLPLTTGLIPFAGAVAGAAAGVSKPIGRNKPIRRGFYGATAGLLAGQVAGNLLETERRRRNAAANEAAAQKDELGF